MPYWPACSTALWYTGLDEKAAFSWLCEWARPSSTSAHHGLKCSVSQCDSEELYFQPVIEIAVLLQQAMFSFSCRYSHTSKLTNVSHL